MKLERISRENWSIVSENVHRTVFGKVKPASFDRIDYALMTIDETTRTPLSYLTAREQDHESVYWQFGGSFPGTKGTIQSIKSFQAFVTFERTRGMKRVSFLVENTNPAMLKLAMLAGFLIVGVRNFQGTVLLEHVLEF